MADITESLQSFLEYVALLKGDEKGEAQVFCDRLFQAFGHKGYKEAGAELEFRIKKESARGTSFADLIWKPRLLIEMKKRGENLFHYYQQAFDYWIHAVPDRPRYVVLCNFDEFWIYDFDKQIDARLKIKRHPGGGERLAVPEKAQ
ncbi:MAG: type IIL restriction-modification enzyme MmeI, partial [Pseudomonadota bacterium]